MTQPTHQNALPLGSTLMEYRLQAVLGAGGFGITYLARDTNLDKDVAIKEYLPGAFAVRCNDGSVVATSAAQAGDYKWGLERFIQEARTLAKFSHPHIVRVNRFFEANGTGYMVMDYEAGQPFKACLQREGFSAEGSLKALLAPLLDGLEKVHAAGFLHRDIKPDNIFVRKDGSPVLIDFGSARQAVGASQALTTIVSPGYAPFEQYTTTDEQGPWSDIYSLCGVVFFAMTGQSPPDAITRMKADTVPQALRAARARYSGPFVDAIAWGLAREQKDRPQTVAQLRDALLGQRPAASAPSPAATTPTVKAAPVARPPSGNAAAPVTILIAREERRKPTAGRWLVVGLAALAVIVVGGRSMTGPVDPPASPPSRATANSSAPQEPVVETSRESTSTEPIGASEAAQTEAAAAEVTESEQTSVSESATPAPATPPTAAAPPEATPGGAVADPRLQALAGAGSLGLSREDLARLYPAMADRFPEIDRDRDGRVSAAELVDAMQQAVPMRQTGSE
jgi:serine/threonine protein kinase